MEKEEIKEETITEEEEQEEKKRRKFIILIILIILCIIFSVSYIIYEVTGISKDVKIGGNEDIPSSEWNISIANVKKKVTGNAEFSDVVVSKSKLELSYGLVLYENGDSATITFDVKNRGTIDAKLDNAPEVNILSEEQEKYLDYSVTYNDDTSLHQGDILRSLNSDKIKIKISVKEGVNLKDIGEDKINCNFSLNYVQND